MNYGDHTNTSPANKTTPPSQKEPTTIPFSINAKDSQHIQDALLVNIAQEEVPLVWRKKITVS